MLIVLRHGRTEANHRGVLLGRLDVPLDELGERQAAAAVAAIGPVDRVIASPLTRTMQTASAFGTEVVADDRLLELDYGEFDGVAPADLPSGTWERWRADLDFRPPGGESLRELSQRVDKGLEEYAVEASKSRVVLVTHVSPIKATLAWALGVGPDVAWRSFVTPASIMRVSMASGTPSLVAFNDTAHLAGINPD